jgi:bifunctional NMN adenylyltransferase/nudix hydrolase
MSLGVCIGRFQFLTKAHQAIIDTALAHGQVLVIVGSAGEARSVMNPWTFEERKSMLRAVYGDSIMIDSIQDSNYD